MFVSVPRRASDRSRPTGGLQRAGTEALAGAVLGLALFGYWFVLIQSENWLPALAQALAWLRHPVVHGSWPAVPVWPVALASTVALLVVGGFSSLVLFPRGEFDRSAGKFLAYSALFGLTIAGWGVQVAALTGVLYLPVVLAWVAAVGVGTGVIARRKHGPWRMVLRRVVAPALPKDVPRWRKVIGWWILAATVTISLLAVFHASAFPVTEWDALVYHAGAAKIWFASRPAPPVIAGPSVGIEMSANYPSLFPAMAVFYYFVTGGPHDIYLRLLAPIFGAICLTLVFHVAKRLHGVGAGHFAMFLLSVTPLFFIYAVFPTGYAPLMALLIALADCIVGVWETGKHEYAFAAAVLAGLIGSLTYLSAFVYVFLIICSLAFIVRRKIAARAVALAAVLVVVLGGPVYVRNWIALGDPVFPFGSAVFRSPYTTDTSVLRDSIAEIRNNALGYWRGYDEGSLWRVQIRTLLWDKTLLPVGAPAAVAGVLLFASRVRAAAAIFLSWVAFVAATQLLQGWYWLRTLALVLPFLAVLAGTALAEIAQRADRFNGRAALGPTGIEPPLTRLILCFLFVAISIFPGLTLAWAGPNQRTWTPFLRPQDDYSRAWRLIGDTPGWIRHVYTGDYDAWQWLNRHLGGRGRSASLDNRWYYLERYDSVLFLDGREGVPLLEIDRPAEIIRYLRARGVRYVLSPAWVGIGSARHPLIDRLPLYRHLGSSAFPLVTAFEVDDADIYTRIYAVGPAQPEPGVRVIRARQEGDSARFPAGAENGRIVVVLPFEGMYRLEFEYRDDGDQPIDLNHLRSADGADWKAFSFLPRAGTKSWIARSFVLAGFRDVLVLGVYARGTDAVIRKLSIRRLPAGDDELAPGDVIVPGGNARFTLPLSSSFRPTSARITLNIPEGTRSKVFQAYAGGHPISLELWKGRVAERTAWWRRHQGVARVPDLPMWGKPVATLEWTPTPGIYTLMIIPWGRDRPPRSAAVRVVDAAGPAADR